jgi:bifunctional UDP-N-acetylglucosamine pyrophosphorylase/glucosamine-1-phosphate N-acetyltransferase
MSGAFAAVVLCAGKGTRMKSARAKVLHELLGRPLCAHSLECAVAVGADPVVAVVGHQAEDVERAVKASLPGHPILFAVQERQLGTAHAVLSARRTLARFKGQVFILYGDTPLLQPATLRALAREKRKRRSALALVTARPPSPRGYGRIIRSESGVERIVEDRDCSTEERAIGEVNAGVYLADSGFLWRALDGVKQGNAQAEFYLTDLVAVARRAEAGVAAIEAPWDEVAGVNDRVELARAAQKLRARINDAHMRAGVTFDDPESVRVDAMVRLGTDVRIGPDVALRGSTRIGNRTSVDAGCVVSNSVVGTGVQLKPYCVLEDAVVGNQAVIGPFARLRPGTELSEGVHIGNFVETKKARIGRGSKANHLTYLGDCEIGRGVNVGAGTITCNYDGVHKHRTVLGDGVFVGSDSQFVAPVTVGKGAYIGAGSTIVEEVPPFSLAIARGRQVTKEGYVKRRRGR